MLFEERKLERREIRLGTLQTNALLGIQSLMNIGRSQWNFVGVVPLNRRIKVQILTMMSDIWYIVFSIEASFIRD